LLKRKKKKKATIRKEVKFDGKFDLQFFWCERSLQKGSCVTNAIFGRTSTFGCEK
jgi:hypothetical protein